MALLAGGQREVATLDGFRTQQIGKLRFVIHGLDIELAVEIVRAYSAACTYSKFFRQRVGNGYLQTLPLARTVHSAIPPAIKERMLKERLETRMPATRQEMPKPTCPRIW